MAPIYLVSQRRRATDTVAAYYVVPLRGQGDHNILNKIVTPRNFTDKRFRYTVQPLAEVLQRSREDAYLRALLRAYPPQHFDTARDFITFVQHELLKKR